MLLLHVSMRLECAPLRSCMRAVTSAPLRMSIDTLCEFAPGQPFALPFFARLVCFLGWQCTGLGAVCQLGCWCTGLVLP